jgi:DNA-binding XRE family transcriptional regulator
VDTLLLQTPAQLPLHLKALRKHRGLTQSQVASRLGIKQARYAFIETRPETVSTQQLSGLISCCARGPTPRRPDPERTGERPWRLDERPLRR